MKNRVSLATFCIYLFSTVLYALPAKHVDLRNGGLQISWVQQDDGWHVDVVKVKQGDTWRTVPSPLGLYTIIYLNRNPSLRLVELDKEGTTYAFYPSAVDQRPDGSLLFHETLSIGDMTAEWRIDPDFKNDVRVKISIVASRKGYFSLASPTLVKVDPAKVTWGTVPGNWYGTDLQSNYELSPQYSQGIPNRPYLARERNTMTLSPILSEQGGISIGVIPDPGVAADPWEKNKSTRDTWKLGLSTMDRYGQLTPVLYHPIVGQDGSQLDPGGTTSLSFRYSIMADSWFAIFRHAVEDIYRFADLLALQQSTMSLSDRVARIGDMLRDDQKSDWRVIDFHGRKIGADGTKTADVGAMYMLAKSTGDPVLNSRLLFLRNYKLAQQQMSPGFFQYAATGEYPSENSFVAERGNWIEPLFTTYYTMMDMGNIALFDPNDKEVRERVRLAAEKLMTWQHLDGSWDVAYDRNSHILAFPQLRDLRPTWYGLFVAWRILKDPRYLAAARRGADWYLKNAVDPTHYLGACGDALDIWDFTTIFGSQTLLDLYDATGDSRYREAALNIAHVYATTIFTHPIPSATIKEINGVGRPDWEMSQVGLSVEHIRGTANGGPILLSSHAGLFVRIYEMTKDRLFLEMARAAARGRQDFVDPDTGESVYYWNTLDRVASQWKAFPWHAEWQVGWIMDYLLSEAHLRSAGKISFPHGFPAPKVGSHVTYGFAPGLIYGHPAQLLLGQRAAKCESPNSECVSALSVDSSILYLIVMNQLPKTQQVSLTFDTMSGSPIIASAELLNAPPVTAGPATNALHVTLPPWGIGVIAMDRKTHRASSLQ